MMDGAFVGEGMDYYSPDSRPRESMYNKKSIRGTAKQSFKRGSVTDKKRTG